MSILNVYICFGLKEKLDKNYNQPVLFHTLCIHALHVCPAFAIDNIQSAWCNPQLLVPFRMNYIPIKKFWHNL